MTATKPNPNRRQFMRRVGWRLLRLLPPDRVEHAAGQCPCGLPEPRLYSLAVRSRAQLAGAGLAYLARDDEIEIESSRTG